MPLTVQPPQRALSLMIQFNAHRARIALEKGDRASAISLLEAIVQDATTSVALLDGLEDKVNDELEQIVKSQRD